MSANHHHLTTPGELPVLGVDVSKLTLDTCLLHLEKPRHQRFANDATGIGKLLEQLRTSGIGQALVAMEATGPYSLPLAMAAAQAGHAVVVINPRRLLDYARACERRNKTDRADAALIARFAAREALPRWQPLPADQQLFRELLRRQADLEQRLHAEERRLEMLPQVGPVAQSLQRSVRWLAKELQRLEQAITRHLQGHGALAADIDRLQAIPGIGQKSARLLTAEIPRHFANARAVAAWLGCVPRRWLSGSSVHKPSRIGHAAPSLRAKLYFVAIAAMRFDPRCKALAQRLAEAGKAKMSIVFAVLHKLIRTAFALLKHGATYQPDHAITVGHCSP